MTKYFMHYQEKEFDCSVELSARTDNGARKKAKSLAKQDQIRFYDIYYKTTDGRNGRLCANAKRWA